MESDQLFSVEDNVVMITGASRGLGLTLAGAFAERGAHVGMLARDPGSLAEAASKVERRGSGQVVASPGDVTSERDIARFFADCQEQLGTVDVLITNAAAINRPREMSWEMSKEAWERILAVTLTGTYLPCRRALQEMVPRGAGKIVCVASTSSVLASYGHAPYAAGKTGLMGMIRTMALEAAPTGVTINAIGPAYMRTEMTAPSLEDPERREQILQSLPLGRVLEPEDLIGPALFLACPASDVMTGQLLLVDAGQTLR